jgi:hypothetical protein
VLTEGKIEHAGEERRVLGEGRILAEKEAVREEDGSDFFLMGERKGGIASAEDFLEPGRILKGGFADEGEVEFEVSTDGVDIPPVDGEGGVECDELFGGGDVTVAGSGDEGGTILLGEEVTVDVADPGFEFLDGALAGLFGEVPGSDGLGDFAEAEEAFGAGALDGAVIRVCVGEDGIGLGGTGILAGAVLFHGPFELDGGFIGEVMSSAFVEGVGNFGIGIEDDVAESVGLGGGTRFIREGIEENADGFVDTAFFLEGRGAIDGGTKRGRKFSDFGVEVCADDNGEEHEGEDE